MDQTPEHKPGAERAAWGEGRIAYAAHASHIQQLIAQKWPLIKIYRELESQLLGLSYQQFTYHVRRQTPKTAPAPRAQDDNGSVSAPEQSQTLETIERNQDEQNKTPNRTGKRFVPGPRVPDPSQLY